jgi:hypothetical protein
MATCLCSRRSRGEIQHSFLRFSQDAIAILAEITQLDQSEDIQCFVDQIPDIFCVAIERNWIGFQPSKGERIHSLDPAAPESVAGEFRAVPKLQGHMTAIYGKVVELDRLGQDKIERGLVERIFDKFQCIIAEFTNRVEALRRNIEETATREEINTLLQDLLNSLHSKSETVIDQVRCMTCHREMVKVTGAVPEENAEKALSEPPNSISIPSQTPSTGVSYSLRHSFDSAITTIPKSKRAARPTATRPRVK